MGWRYFPPGKRLFHISILCKNRSYWPKPIDPS